MVGGGGLLFLIATPVFFVGHPPRLLLNDEMLRHDRYQHTGVGLLVYSLVLCVGHLRCCYGQLRRGSCVVGLDLDSEAGEYR